MPTTYSLLLDLNGLVRDDAVLRDDGVFVLAQPHDDPDSVSYQAWLQAGNAPSQPIPTPAPAPSTVTPRQARLVLYIYGLLDQVEVAVNAAGGTTKITWDYATVITRDDPLISQIAQVLKLSDAQIDEMFTMASTL